MDDLDAAMAEIVEGVRSKPQPLQTRDELIAWLRLLPEDAEVLCFGIKTDEATGEKSGLYAQFGCDSPLAGAALAWLSMRGFLRGRNPMLDALRGLLPPGHPLA